MLIIYSKQLKSTRSSEIAATTSAATTGVEETKSAAKNMMTLTAAVTIIGVNETKQQRT